MMSDRPGLKVNVGGASTEMLNMGSGVGALMPRVTAVDGWTLSKGIRVVLMVKTGMASVNDQLGMAANVETMEEYMENETAQLPNDAVHSTATLAVCEDEPLTVKV